MPRLNPFNRYALLAGAAFIFALILIGLMLWRADSLVSLGLIGRFFYLVLIPLGLSSAVFLFGCLKSYAVYKGNALGGVLELGGPVVVFILVLILGFWLNPDSSVFSTTVYVRLVDAPTQPFVSGRVLLQLGGDPRNVQVSERGAAYFTGIPANFRGDDVAVSLLDAPGYQANQSTLRLEDGSVNLAVIALPLEFSGYVINDTGQPVEGARIGMAGQSTETDSGGYFRITVQGSSFDAAQSIQITAQGFAPWLGEITAGAGDLKAKLERL